MEQPRFCESGKARINRISGFIMKLSLEEKFRLLTAKDAWTTQDFGGKIKSVRMTDGPHGVRRCDDKETIKSTAYPALSLVGGIRRRRILWQAVSQATA